MYTCAVIDDYQNVAAGISDWSRIADKVKVTFFHDRVATRGPLVDRLKNYDIIAVMRERTPFDRSLLEQLPRLKLLLTTGQRNASIDVAAANERGVTVCGTSSLESPAAELTWALILALARKLPLELREFQRGGPWQNTLGMDLAGAQLGIIGLGRLGARVARVALAFDMKVMAWSANLSAERCTSLGVEHAGSLDRVLTSSDIVSIHMILSDRTRGLIGAPQLRRMKPSALLINTARAPIIDEAALITALQERWIAGAGLDVFDQEPLPLQHPFRSLDHVVTTPHLGFVTEGNYRRFYGMIVEDIAAWLQGAPIRLLGEHPAAPKA
jgi:phosphoglycerate dehydrogenase-like enzyme